MTHCSASPFVPSFSMLAASGHDWILRLYHGDCTCTRHILAVALRFVQARASRTCQFHGVATWKACGESGRFESFERSSQRLPQSLQNRCGVPSRESTTAPHTPHVQDILGELGDDNNMQEQFRESGQQSTKNSLSLSLDVSACAPISSTHGCVAFDLLVRSDDACGGCE